MLNEGGEDDHLPSLLCNWHSPAAHGKLWAGPRKVKQVLSHAKEFLKICLKNQLHSDTLNWSACVSSPGTRSNITPMLVIFHCPHSSKPKLLCYRQNNVCTQLNSRECCFCTSEWEYRSAWACSPFSPSYHDLSTSLFLICLHLSLSLSLSLSLRYMSLSVH